MSEQEKPPVSSVPGATPTTPTPGGRVIELGAANQLAPKQEATAEVTRKEEKSEAGLKELPPKFTHQLSPSGGHRLIMEIVNQSPIYSDHVGYGGIARCVHPVTGVLYCATTDHYRDVLPEVFAVIPQSVTQSRGQ